jgi:cell division protease FtsH
MIRATATRYLSEETGVTPRAYSENVAAAIDEEVKEIIENCHAAKQKSEIIEKHRFVLDECARQLMEKEKLNRKNLRRFLQRKKICGGRGCRMTTM